MKRLFVIIIFLTACCLSLSAQSERKEVRRGNKDFKAENYGEAEVDYKKALLADSTSTAAAFNLANTYYRLENYSEADKYYDSVTDTLADGPHGAAAYHNMGNSLLAQKNYQAAIEAYKNSLRRNPSDMETKSNLAYAQKMLENQQNGGGTDQDQNQEQQQNQDQNQDQDQDQNQDQDQDQNQSDSEQQPEQQPKISPQTAEQLLQAIQDEERRTQDKVNKEKALKLKSKQKEKNW